MEWYDDLHTVDAHLTFTEIKAWSDVTGRRVRGWEAELLRIIDRVHWKVQHE